MAGLSDSRFYLWRAVVALAHADNRVTKEEHDFVDRYLVNVPFSPEQKEILKNDLADPQEVAEMFDKIAEPVDQGEFFEFARMICWCDGDYDAQEDKLFEYLKDTQMHRINKDAMVRLVQETRNSQQVARAKEDEQFRAKAHKLVGLGAMISRVG